MPTSKQLADNYKYMAASKANYDSREEKYKIAFWEYATKNNALPEYPKMSPSLKTEYDKYVGGAKIYGGEVSQKLYQPSEEDKKANPDAKSFFYKDLKSDGLDYYERLQMNPNRDAMAQKPQPTSSDKRRLLNEQRLEELTPTAGSTAIKNPIKKSKSGLLNFINATSGKAVNTIFGTDYNQIDSMGKGMDTATDVTGAILGYTAPIGEAGSLWNAAGKITNAAGKAVSKVVPKAVTNAAGKLATTKAGNVAMNIGKKALEGAPTGAILDTLQGVQRGESKEQILNRVGQGLVIGAGANIGLSLLGKAGQAMLKKFNMPKDLEIEIKRNIGAFTIDSEGNVYSSIDKDGNALKAPRLIRKLNKGGGGDSVTASTYVDPYGNVRKTPETDLQLGTPKQNLPKVNNFNSITKTVGKPEKTILIGNPIENTINKVSTKKIKLTPEEVQLDNVIKRSGTNIDELIGEAEKKVKDLEEQQFQYLKGNKAKGVQSANIIRDDTGTVTGRFGKVSNNDQWYRDFYAENKRPPTNSEMREMAKKQLREGFGTNTMDIPANEEYMQAVKDLESYRNIKGVNTPSQSTPLSITKKGIQPTPQLIPSTLREKGITLTTNKPIQSALDARLNKPYIANDNRMTDDAITANKKKLGLSTDILPPGITKINKAVVTPPLAPKAILEPPVKPQNIASNATKTAKEVPIVSKIGKEIEAEMEGATHTSNNFVKEIAPTIKDAKFGASFSMTDIYRNFKHAFGKNYEAVKKSVLDPFDKAKKAYVDEQKVYTDGLYNNVVKKLGINKNTKESSAVQWFGEGKKMSGVEETIDPQTGQKIKKAVEVPYTLDDLKKDFPDKWQNIVEADKWFRKSYDELIDKVNATIKQIYPNNPDKLVPKRADYYRHFKEMTNGFEGLKNVFDTPSNIDPKLVGISDYTQPKTKWQSYKQKRGLGEYKSDAVGGFLDYIKAASYSIHIDPQINVFRSMAKDIAETTEQSKNANNFIKFLRGYADDLAGKTNSIDRPFLNETNRQFMNIINAGNVRIKKNTVLMNAKSALSQLANVPLGVAKVKNPIHISKGVGETLAGFVGKGKAPDAYKQSQFITERYADKLYRRFDTKLLDQPEKFASWLLESTDELGTKMIWNSVHNQAIAKGIKDPIKYADDVTRSLVAGRGIGEVPLAQKAKAFQIVAPFQLEVANQWHVMKDFINEKDFAAIPILLLGNYLFNTAVQSVTGSRVTFDPINAMVEAMGEEKTTPMQKLGRLGGEVLSNMPLGSTIASQLPEATRMKYFGRTDPTRFGTGLMLTKGLQDPLYKLLPPMGGGQIKKSIEGLKSMQILPKDLQGNKQVVPGSYNKGKLRFPVEKTPANIAKAALFGQYSSKEAVEYFRRNGKELSEEQTKQLELFTKNGGDPKVFYDKLLIRREIDKLKTELSNTVKNDRLNIKKAQDLRDKINELKKKAW
jgi:hypothetical protein